MTVLYSMCVFFSSVIYIYKSANAVVKLQIIFCNPLTQIALLCVTYCVPPIILSPVTVTRQPLLPDEALVGKKRHYNCICH
jgi:hypothetical protein